MTTLAFTEQKEEVVHWKGKSLTLKGFANMIPQMTKTDVDVFLDNKELVELATKYLKEHPEEKKSK